MVVHVSLCSSKCVSMCTTSMWVFACVLLQGLCVVSVSYSTVNSVWAHPLVSLMGFFGGWGCIGVHLGYKWLLLSVLQLNIYIFF